MKGKDVTQLATADVAHWMSDAFSALGTLRRVDAAKGIERRFGPGFVYKNRNGNRAIGMTVVTAFRSLNHDAVWDPCSLSWCHQCAPHTVAGKRGERDHHTGRGSREDSVRVARRRPQREAVATSTTG